MDALNLNKDNLKKFGITMAIVLTAISLLIFIKRAYLPLPVLIIALLFLAAALFIPASLKGIYIFWMRLAYLLGWINTRLILCVVFYLVFAPIGIIIRLFGKDLLDIKIDKNKGSYWIKKEQGLVDYGRQF